MTALVEMLNPNVSDYHLGMIPQWLDCIPSSMTIPEWFNTTYAHGGGWQPFKGFKLRASDMALTYPGDPAQLPFAKITLSGRDEVIYMYPHAWVMILWPDQRFEVCRMD